PARRPPARTLPTHDPVTTAGRPRCGPPFPEGRAMSDVRGSIGRGVQRAAMFASIFVAGGIVGWVASERDLLPAPPRGTVATASADTAAMPPAIAPAAAG